MTRTIAKKRKAKPTTRRQPSKRKDDQLSKHVAACRKYADHAMKDSQAKYYYIRLVDFATRRVWYNADAAGTRTIMGTVMFLTAGNSREARDIYIRLKSVLSKEVERGAVISEDLLELWNLIILYIATLEKS